MRAWILSISPACWLKEPERHPFVADNAAPEKAPPGIHPGKFRSADEFVKRYEKP